MRDKLFDNYARAAYYAQTRANAEGRDCAIDIHAEYGRTVYYVRSIPAPRDCYGAELTWQRFTPQKGARR